MFQELGSSIIAESRAEYHVLEHSSEDIEYIAGQPHDDELETQSIG